MLACMTEVASPAWRDGMIEGLTRGLALAVDDELRGKKLMRAVARGFDELTPTAYHTYAQAYLHQEYFPVIIPKMLSFWQWRYLASDLVEIVQAAELLGCSGGVREEEARSALLLDDSDESTAPYLSLLAHGGPTDPEPHYLDGLVDGYSLCWQILYDWGLDGVEYCAAVMEQLDLFWPADYKLYRSRVAHERRLSPTIAHCRRKSPPGESPLDYNAWCAAVDDLAAEVDGSTAAGEVLSHRGRELCRLLLCEDNEPLPSYDWTLPERLEKEMSESDSPF